MPEHKRCCPELSLFKTNINWRGVLMAKKKKKQQTAGNTIDTFTLELNL